jgi:hypothetical protein
MTWSAAPHKRHTGCVGLADENCVNLQCQRHIESRKRSDRGVLSGCGSWMPIPQSKRSSVPHWRRGGHDDPMVTIGRSAPHIPASEEPSPSGLSGFIQQGIYSRKGSRTNERLTVQAMVSSRRSAHRVSSFIRRRCRRCSPLNRIGVDRPPFLLMPTAIAFASASSTKSGMTRRRPLSLAIFRNQ